MGATHLLATALLDDLFYFGLSLDQTAEEVLVSGTRVGVDSTGRDAAERLDHFLWPARINDEVDNPIHVGQQVAERLHAQEPEFSQIGPVFFVAQ